VNEPKKVFVLWSGGVDSTALIIYLLGAGCRVTAGRITILNNEQQTRKEVAAIDKMAPIIRSFHPNFTYTGSVSDICINGSGNNVLLQQVPMFLTVIYQLRDYDEFAMGYVMNDDAVSFVPDIINIYNSYKPLVQNLPTITFPLLKERKTDIYYALPESLKPLVVWCDSTCIDDAPCGHCHSCERMINIGLMEKPSEDKLKVEDDEECCMKIKEDKPIYINFYNYRRY
jgi:7-cyano-7-deazaguanine synthase in queuosine biosynthesis